MIYRFAKQTALVAGRLATRIVSLRGKKVFSPDAVYILLLKPLGIGDLMMLSPFVCSIASKPHNLPVHIVSDSPELFSVESVRWIHPNKLSSGMLKGALVISPTFSFRHAEYLAHAGWYLGYFLSDILMSNVAHVHFRYDARHGHYIDRTVPIVTALQARWRGETENTKEIIVCREAFTGTVLPPEYAVLAPYSNWPERQYPVEYWRTVATELMTRLPVVIAGGAHPDELAMAASLASVGAINIAGKTTLGQLSSVIAGSSIYLGNDSGPSHIAFLVAPASVVVFGCVGGVQRIPRGGAGNGRIRILGAGRECSRFPCYDGFSWPRCNNREPFRCLGAVPPASVVHEVISLIGCRG